MYYSGSDFMAAYVQITGIPAKTTYSVSYNANGGSGAPGAQTKWYGETLTLSSTKPTRSSYSFNRWNTNTSNTGTGYNPGASYTANAALTLYAIWNPIISYNANGGSGAPASQTKTFGTNLTLSSSVPTREGYAFAAWNTSSSGTGSTYQSGGVYSSNSAATLYAIWTPIISYDANGGDGAPGEQTKPLNSALTLSSTVPARAGYVFRCWNTASDGSGTDYYPEGQYASTSTAILYAQWDNALKISSFAIERADSSGNSDVMGSYIKCSLSWETSGVSGTVAEFSSGQTTSTVELSGSSATTTAILDAGALPTSDYTVYATVSDETGGTRSAIAVTTASSTGYKLPVLQAMEVIRCGSDGYYSDDGTYAKVDVDWVVSAVGSQVAPRSLVVTAYDGSAVIDTHSVSTFTGSQGTYTHVFGYGSTFSADKPYTFVAELSDAVSTVTKGDVLSIAYFTFDVLAGGHGVAFGKPSSTAELMDVAYEVHSDTEVSATDADGNVHNLTEKVSATALSGYVSKSGDTMTGSITINDSEVDESTAPSSDVWNLGVYLNEAGGDNVGHLRTMSRTDGTVGVQLQAHRTVNDTNYWNGLRLGFAADGTPYVGINQAAAWRTALGLDTPYLPLAGGNMTGPINFNGKGANSFYNGPNDAFNDIGGELNNLVISSWYGVSFTTSCTGQTYTGKNAVSINCRSGVLRAKTIETPTRAISFIAGAKGDAGLYAKKAYNVNAWYPAVCLDTKGGGSWQMGNYDNEYLLFAYATKANRDSGTNSTTQVRLRNTGGTIALTPAVLYNNTSGTNGTVTLSASAASYNHMRIYYRNASGQAGHVNQYNTTDVFTPNGKYVNLAIVGPDNTGDLISLNTRLALVSGTTINNARSVSGQVGNSTGAGVYSEVYIVRVEAWNE